MKIPCSNCGQRLEIPEELAGQTIECPACNASLAVPSIEAPPPAPPQIRVTTPQASAPQKPALQRKIAAPPIAASPKKTKSLIPKLAIGAIAGVAVVVLIMIFSGGSKDVSESKPTTARVEWKPQEASSQPFESVAEFVEQRAAGKKLSNAITNNDLEEVKNLLADGVDLNQPTYGAFGPPLSQAISSGHKEIVELLIANGADVNAKRIQNITYLHDAAYEHRKDIVELLIANGADVNAKARDDIKGTTPLDSANMGFGSKRVLRGRFTANLKKNRTEIADIIRKHGGKTGEELKAEGK